MFVLLILLYILNCFPAPLKPGMMRFLYSLLFTCPLLLSLQPQQPTFKAQTIDSTVAIGYGLALGDVDGDGRQDILLADQKQFVWYRNGDWKRFVMAENLTGHDNVCIAARDLNGDGKVEVAVGAQWNPGETGNKETSGSVHYLVAPNDVTQPWKAVQLYHEPTIHRMRWFSSGGKFYLAVLPLHGINNKNGTGAGVRLLLYPYRELLSNPNRYDTLQTNMHLTHNFSVLEERSTDGPLLAVAGKEGVRFFRHGSGNAAVQPRNFPRIANGCGEVRTGKLAGDKNFIATIEPMHGTQVVAYLQEPTAQRVVLDADVSEGHAVATADFLGTGSHQVVAGWRVPNKAGKVGVKLYRSKDAAGKEWVSEWIDENSMACEDIQVADLNEDGKPDIVASGRSTHNLKIYWNQSR